MRLAWLYLESREKVERVTALYLTHQGGDQLLSGLPVRVESGQTAPTGSQTVHQVVSVAPPPLHVGLLQVVLQIFTQDLVVMAGEAGVRAGVVTPQVRAQIFSNYVLSLSAITLRDSFII